MVLSGGQAAARLVPAAEGGRGGNMKRAEFNLATTGGKKLVKGYIAESLCCPGLSLMIGLSPDGPGWWEATEVSTGGLVACGRTRTAALRAAEKRLSDAGPEAVKALLAKFLKKHGQVRRLGEGKDG